MKMILIAMLLVGLGPGIQDAHAQKIAVVMQGHTDFAVQAQSMASGLQTRGYAVTRLTDAPPATALTNASVTASLRSALASASSGDSVVFSLHCHGANGSNDLATESVPWTNHICCLDLHCRQTLTAPQIRAIAQAAPAGVRLTVVDNSCTGGATVLGLEGLGPNVCAIASTALNGPASTGLPILGPALSDPTTRTFEDLAGAGQIELLRESPQRSFQRMYFSGCARESMALRSNNSRSGRSLGRFDLQSTAVGRYIADAPHSPGANPEALGPHIERSCRLSRELDTTLATYVSSVTSRLNEEALRSGFAQAYHRRVMAMRAGGVPFPVDQVRDLPSLLEAIRAGAARTQQLRAEVHTRVERLNTVVTELATSSTISLGLEAGTLRQEIRQRLDAILENEAAFNRLLTVYEEADCSTRESPCRSNTL
jgi:hypothetical protein